MAAPAARAALLVVLLLVAGGCDAPPDPDHLPDALLRDSLGLDDGDRVWTVRLWAPEHRERAAPPEIRVPPGAWVQFVTVDGRLHLVRFRVDEMGPEQVDFLTRTGQDRGPPLLERGARLVLSFQDAPEGRYPYRVEGSGEAAEGLIVVGSTDDPDG